MFKKIYYNIGSLINKNYDTLFVSSCVLKLITYFICNKIYGDNLPHFYKLWFILNSFATLFLVVISKMKLNGKMQKAFGNFVVLALFMDIIDRVFFDIRIFVNADYLILLAGLLLLIIAYVGKSKRTD